LTTLTISAQEKISADTTDRLVQLEEVVLSGNKFAEKKRNIVQKIDIITSRYIARVNAQNTGDLLMGTGNVFVQKSQQGGSSPVIRGFEASRVLMVVDGVRMNNAIYRSGHLQNVITVDQNMLERVEVSNGPSSTLFGSDALGGTVQLVTKKVRLASGNESRSIGGNVLTRYSSANDEKTVHADANFGGRKLGFMTSLTFSDFGHMRMGNKYPPEFPDFGRRSYYIEQLQGPLRDSIVKNEDDRVQRFSGYRQWDIQQKVLYKPSDKVSHELNLQFSNSSNVPRYDRLQDLKDNTLRFAEWYYGPQKRNLIAYTLLGKELKGFFNEIRLTISNQDIHESRQTREYKRYDRFDSRRERIGVLGSVLDTRKVMGNHELNLGIDGQWNRLKSVADRTDLLSGQVSKLDSRYPNGKNKMDFQGIYGQHILKLKDGKLVLNDGLRFQMVQLHSTIEDNSFFNLPVTDIRQRHAAFTGNLGLAWMPSNANRLAIGFASGFRSPNIDDLAKIFESNSSARRVVVPNPDLSPEMTYGLDLNHTLVVHEKVRLETAIFHTWFRNAIVMAPFQLNGKDSIPYNGAMCQVVASQNRNKATVWGIQASLSADFNEHFSFQTSLNHTTGRFETDPNIPSSIYQKQTDGSYKLVKAAVASKPLDHIPPLFGKTSVQFRNKQWNFELFAHYNGWKRLDQYNADGEDNAQYATDSGTPSWLTLNLRSGLNLKPGIRIQLAVENILDRNYRYFASGFSAPGRNFVVALRAGF
jgi:hemoglobin/transferrin/lactoferrin receptor protein